MPDKATVTLALHAMRLPEADLSAFYEGLDHQVAFEVQSALSDLAQAAASADAYFSFRNVGQSHPAAARQADRRSTAVRRAMGFTHP